MGRDALSVRIKPLLRWKKEVKEFIDGIYDGEVLFNDRNILDGREIDVLIPDFKIGIELNGLFYHSEEVLSGRVDDPRKYHLNKTLAAKEKGITLIHVFESEWLDEGKRVY